MKLRPIRFRCNWFYSIMSNGFRDISVWILEKCQNFELFSCFEKSTLRGGWHVGPSERLRDLNIPPFPPSCSLGPGPLRSPRRASEFAIKYVYICICVDFQTFTYLYVWIFINKPHGDSFFWLGLVQSAECWRLTEPKQKTEIWSYIRFTYRKTGYGSYVYICICIDFRNCTYVYVWIFMNKPYEDSFFLAWLSSVCGRLKADWT